MDQDFDQDTVMFSFGTEYKQNIIELCNTTFLNVLDLQITNVFNHNNILTTKDVQW